MIRIGVTLITVGVITLMVSDWMRDTRPLGLAVFAAGYVLVALHWINTGRLRS